MTVCRRQTISSSSETGHKKCPGLEPRNEKGTARLHSVGPSGNPNTYSRHNRVTTDSICNEDPIQVRRVSSVGDSGWHRCGHFKVRITLVGGESDERRNWITGLCSGKAGK